MITATTIRVPGVGEVGVRPARAVDLGPLTGVLADRDFLADRLARQRRGDGVLLTGWQGGRPLGGLYVWLEEAEEPELRAHLPGVPLLNHVEVRPDVRGRGVGTALIGVAERLLVAGGRGRVALAVEQGNEAAARLYTRLGYVDWGKSLVTCYAKQVAPDGHVELVEEKCHIMVKELRPA